MTAKAVVVRRNGEWVLRLSLRAVATGDRSFRLASAPAPHLDGIVTYTDGSSSSFGDGCWADLGEGIDPVLAPGEERTFTGHYTEDELVGLEPGDAIELQVGLCRVGLDDGRWEDALGPVVHFGLDEDGRAWARVTPMPTRPRP